MSTSAPTINFDHSSDAAFRTWGKAMSDGLRAVGLVPTADTGQINWATVTKPANGGEYAGYEIYKLADAVDATQPCYIKMSYGNYQYGPGYPSMKMEISTGTNGAGGLTTWSSGANGFEIVNSSFPAEARQCYFSGDGSSFVFALMPSNPVAGGQGYLYGVDRFRNADGTPNGRGLYAFRQIGSPGNANGNFVGMFDLANKISRVEYVFSNVPTPIGLYSSVDGLDVYTFPHYTYSKKPEGLAKPILCFYNSDIPYGVTFQVTHLGATHTFLSLGSTVPYMAQSNSYMCAAIIWE